VAPKSDPLDEWNLAASIVAPTPAPTTMSTAAPKSDPLDEWNLATSIVAPTPAPTTTTTAAALTHANSDIDDWAAMSAPAPAVDAAVVPVAAKAVVDVDDWGLGAAPAPAPKAAAPTQKAPDHTRMTSDPLFIGDDFSAAPTQKAAPTLGVIDDGFDDDVFGSAPAAPTQKAVAPPQKAAMSAYGLDLGPSPAEKARQALLTTALQVLTRKYL
jgi:hypothetical protein